MRVHNIEVTDRAAYVDDRDLVQGTVKADICKFSFDSDWDGLSITVTFVSDSDQATPTYDEENKQCVVPWEVLTGSGSVQMGIEGVDSSGSVVRTAQLASPFNVKPTSRSSVMLVTRSMTLVMLSLILRKLFPARTRQQAMQMLKLKQQSRQLSLLIKAMRLQMKQLLQQLVQLAMLQLMQTTLLLLQLLQLHLMLVSKLLLSLIRTRTHCN